MGNKQAKKTNSMIDQENTRLRAENTRFNNTYRPERTEERAVATNQRNDIYGGYKNLLDPNKFDNFFGFDKAMGPGGGGGGGGYTAQTYTPAKAALSGYIGESANIARALGAGGVWDPKIREGYTKFADTGGFTPEDIQNIRQRGTSNIPSFYEAIRNQMAQKANAAGINNASIFSAASGRLTRQQAQAAQEAALNTELGISDQIRAGKQLGLEGLFGLDKSSNEFRSQGMQGLLGAGSEENAMNRYNTDAENTARQFNTNEINSAAASGAAASRANQDMLFDMAKLRENAYLTGLGGMMDVYTSSPAELARYDNLDLQNRDLTGGQIGSNINTRAQYNPNVSWFDRAMQGAGAVAGLVGAF